MKEDEFLARLKKETGNARLVEYYEELIADRVANGEDEKAVVDGFDIKRIVRTAELEKGDDAGMGVGRVADTSKDRTQETPQVPGQVLGGLASRCAGLFNRSHVYLAIAVISLFAVLGALAGIGYNVVELIDELNATRRDNDWIEYMIYIIVSGIAFVTGVVVGIIALVKFAKYKKR